MISRLQGVLLEKSPPQLLLDVGGVGYEVHAPMSTFYQLPETGQEICLLTHLVVREDAHILYGFVKPHERNLFRDLIRVNGVGPKMALAILSGIATDTFVQCVLDNNTGSLTRVPGIGQKTAERLIVEMRGKLKDWQGECGQRDQSRGGSSRHEAISALIALGYKPQEANKTIGKIQQSDLSSEELIRLALQQMI